MVLMVLRVKMEKMEDKNAKIKEELIKRRKVL